MTPLTQGAVLHIHSTKDTSKFPTINLQVLDVKRILPAPGAAPVTDRYRATLSDGEYTIQGLIPSTFVELVNNNAIQASSIIHVTEYICNTVKDKNIMIIIKCVPAEHTAPIVGNPIPVDQAPQYTGENKENDIKREPSRPHPNTSVPAYMSAKGPVVKTDGGHNDFQPINTLNPYQARWTIKARVTAKSELKTWTNQRGEGKLFSVDLLDAQGGQIRATMFKDSADKFYQIFEQDRVYTISKGQLKLANKKFSRLPNDYEITLNADAEVFECSDDTAIDTQKFSFTTIDRINGIEPNEFIDVIGIVTTVGQLSSINSQKMQKELKKRSVTLTDNSLTSIELTLWNENAEKYNEAELDGNPVLAVKQVKVSDFGGRSIGTTFQSQIFINPDRQESGKLRAWFTQNGGNSATYVSVTQGKQPGEGGQRNSNERKPLSVIKDEQLGFKQTPDYLTSRATVTVVRGDTEKVPWYNACPGPECNKKVTDNGQGMWRCEKCNKDYQTYVPRYVLSVMIADSTSATWLSLFNEHAEKLLGVRAGQLADYIANGNTEAFKEVFKLASMKQMVFKFRCKAEQQQDENKLRCQAINCDEVNYVNESRLLITEIEQYA